MHADTVYADPTDRVPSSLLKWSAVFGGLVLGLAMLLLLSALWLALAYGSEVSAIRDNLGWYVGLSAVASLFVAGILTGYLSGVRGEIVDNQCLLPAHVALVVLVDRVAQVRGRDEH